jgi:hypothetical protein
MWQSIPHLNKYSQLAYGPDVTLEKGGYGSICGTESIKLSSIGNHGTTLVTYGQDSTRNTKRLVIVEEHQGNQIIIVVLTKRGERRRSGFGSSDGSIRIGRKISMPKARAIHSCSYERSQNSGLLRAMLGVRWLWYRIHR